MHYCCSFGSSKSSEASFIFWDFSKQIELAMLHWLATCTCVLVTSPDTPPQACTTMHIYGRELNTTMKSHKFLVSLMHGLSLGS
jgi:hypothetical protein